MMEGESLGSAEHRSFIRSWCPGPRSNVRCIPMPNVVSLSCLILALADPPPSPPAPIDVVSAIESVLADAIEKAEHSVVAIARDRSDDDTTTAVRGKGGPAPEQLTPD